MQTNQKQYTTQQIKTYTLQPQKLKQEMKDTLDINKKIEIAKKIENINKEVLKW